MTISTKKYENSILYLCSKQQGYILRGKKKLAKLLYYVDFDNFEYKESATSITGDSYRALPMGPVPNHFTEIISKLVASDKLTVEQQEDSPGYNPTEIYKCLVEPDMTVFSADEKLILDRVATLYGYLNGKQLEDLTHAEAPYVGTKLNEDIPYELAFYRGTNFDDIPRALAV